jgi:hypothetical protein
MLLKDLIHQTLTKSFQDFSERLSIPQFLQNLLTDQNTNTSYTPSGITGEIFGMENARKMETDWKQNGNR